MSKNQELVEMWIGKIQKRYESMIPDIIQSLNDKIDWWKNELEQSLEFQERDASTDDDFMILVTVDQRASDFKISQFKITDPRQFDTEDRIVVGEFNFLNLIKMSNAEILDEINNESLTNDYLRSGLWENIEGTDEEPEFIEMIEKESE